MGSLVVSASSTDFHIQASGLVTDIDGNYHMNVYQKTTPIVAYTDPTNVTKKRIAFSVTDGGIYLQNPPKNIYAGGVTNIIINTDEYGDLYYGKEIKITISHGYIDKYLVINVLIPTQGVRLDCNLVYTSLFTSEPEDSISARRYQDEDASGFYNVDAALFIDNAKINGDVTWKSECSTEIIAIDLFHKPNSSSPISIDIPPELLSAVILNGDVFPIQFKITATYTVGDMVNEYSVFYTLVIVPEDIED